MNVSASSPYADQTVIALEAGDSDVIASRILGAAGPEHERLAFLLELGHELRTPVTAIVGYVSLATDGVIDPLDALAVVDVKAHELLAVLESMLAAARERQDDDRHSWSRPAKRAVPGS